MSRRLVVILVVLAVLIAAITAYTNWRKARAREFDAAVLALTGLGAPANGSVVRVDFDNAICHFTKTSPAKAALIKDPSEHAARMKIMQPMPLTKAELEKVFGKGNVACDAVGCTIKKIEDLTFRIRGTDDATIQPAFDATSPDFDLFVPHLEKVANVSKMNPKANDRVPATDFSVFFNMEGGTLSAKPFCAQLQLKDVSTSALSDHYVPDLVTLTGSTEKPAQLQFTRNGMDWTTIDFKKAKLIWIAFDNRPAHPAQDHFNIHTKAGDGTDAAKYPKVEKMPKCKSGVTAACGNTQWP